ncbi:MAG TPA: inorganic diphosphatase [Thermomicrobiales bacterium]|jgi:inorganic pyrophosphatase
MKIELIPPCDEDGNVHALIEIARGSRNKYEYNPAWGVLALDRTLYSAVHFPTDYGFVPGTRAADGDPLDILVLVEEPTFPGCLVRTRLLGVLTIETSGGAEPKLLGVPVGEPRFAQYQDIGDLPEHLLREIEHFFAVYKELQGSTIAPLGWQGAAAARAQLTEAIAAQR